MRALSFSMRNLEVEEMVPLFLGNWSPRSKQQYELFFNPADWEYQEWVSYGNTVRHNAVVEAKIVNPLLEERWKCNHLGKR